MMGMQFQIQYSSVTHCRPTNLLPPSIIPPLFFYGKKNKNKNNNSSSSLWLKLKCNCAYDPLFSTKHNFNANSRTVVAAASSSGSGLWDTWSPVSDKSTPSPSLSDIIWPSLGAFVAMAMLAKIDQILAPKGMSITIAPLGAVCAVLFLTPKAPAARKYNMFMAQIGCAAIGVVAFTMMGPGWLARSAGLAASLAFMIYTRSTHPPAASLPLLFIDGAKFHGLNYWYALFPGAAGCILLSVVQEVVYYLKENFKF